MNRGDVARWVDRRRRDPFGAFALIVVALIAISALALGLDRVTNRRTVASSSPSAAPIVEATARPTIESEPTPVPASVAPCSPDDVALAAGGWSGATGSMGGGASLINVSIDPCSIDGMRAVDLLANDGGLIATGTAATPGPVVVLVPGGVASVITVWSNWCGDPRPRALVLRLSLLDWDRGLLAPVVNWPGSGGSVPRCDTPNAPSTIGVPEPWATPQPPDGGSLPEACTTARLSGYLGGWGVAAGTSYANVVVFNQGGVDCFLATSPALELRDASGSLLATGERWTDPDSTFVLPAGWAAIGTIGFAGWCVAPPKLPFRFDLRIGDGQLAIAPTSARSEIGTPTCNSAPATPPPSLGYTGPLVLPGQ
ncbi:MAG: DUF4232 domain-containing protein [Chloroflexi bacterium]|nr:MAG: DUF4232 domain-containing protein [Chloroflexota bacterium]